MQKKKGAWVGRPSVLFASMQTNWIAAVSGLGRMFELTFERGCFGASVDGVVGDDDGATLSGGPVYDFTQEASLGRADDAANCPCGDTIDISAKCHQVCFGIRHKQWSF